MGLVRGRPVHRNRQGLHRGIGFHLRGDRQLMLKRVDLILQTDIARLLGSQMAIDPQRFVDVALTHVETRQCLCIHPDRNHVFGSRITICHHPPMSLLPV